MNTENLKLNRTQIILKKALTLYLMLGIGFGIVGLSVDSFEYIKSELWFLLIINSISVFLILLSLFGFSFKKLRLRTATGLLVYSFVINILLTNLYYIKQGASLFHLITIYRGTIIIAIYFSIAGIILKKVHLIILNALYVITISYLYFNTGKEFSFETALFLTLITFTFSFSVYMFMQKLRNTIELNRKLQREIFKNQKELLKKENELIRMRASQLEKTLSVKNRKLVSASLMLAHSNTEKDKIIKRLETLKTTASRETEKALVALLSEISTSFTSMHWDEFQKRFEEVHPDYLQRIARSFPDLSPTDFRVIAFLKLGLTTKEISVLTSLSTASLEVSRSRLRKKLNLKPSQNMTVFLSKF